MGLFGDKITLGSTTAADLLTKSDGSGVDVLTKSAGTAIDNLTKSSGTAADNLNRDFIFLNEDFENPLSGWTVVTGDQAFIDPGIDGQSLRLTSAHLDGSAEAYYSFGQTLNNVKLRVRFQYIVDAPSSVFTVSQQGSGEIIFQDNSPAEMISATTKEYIITANNMTGINFKIDSSPDGEYFELDNVLVQLEPQDKLDYTI